MSTEEKESISEPSEWLDAAILSNRAKPLSEDEAKAFSRKKKEYPDVCPVFFLEKVGYKGKARNVAFVGAKFRF